MEAGLPTNTLLDLHAIDRTYLGYTRTVLAILALGITILVFELREPSSVIVPGAIGTLVATGVFAIWFARTRLLRLQSEVLGGQFATDRVGPGILVFMLGLLLLSASVFISR